MRYKTDQKETTRKRVLEVAAARFRKDGLDGVGVATLMGEAGLTHGGFYSHFASKEALIEEVIETGMDDSFQRLTSSAGGGDTVVGFIRWYLRIAHLEHPEKGCPAAALGAEIGRHSIGTREAFTRRYLQMVKHINSLLAAPNEAKAQAIFGLLVGTLQLARSVSDRELAHQILNSGETAAITLAEG